MRTSTYTELRQNLAHILDKVSEDHDPIIITRGSSKPTVLLSLEDYNSFLETMHLMGSTANAKRLNDAILSLKNKGGLEKQLIEEQD